MQLLEQDENIIGVSGGWWQGPVFADIEILASAPLRHTPGPGRQVPRLQLQPITLQIQGVMFSTVYLVQGVSSYSGLQSVAVTPQSSLLKHYVGAIFNKSCYDTDGA